MITMRAVRHGLLPGLIVAGVLAASMLVGSSVSGLNFKLVAVCTYGYLGAPTVTGISPTSGSTAGGNAVTITGCGFTGATSVKFGTSAASKTVVNDSTINATSPAHAAGVVDVTVTTGAGTSATSPADQFTYTGTCTSVTATAAPSGTAKAGTIILVTGVAVGCPNPLYEFFVLNPGGSWAVAQPYSPRATFNWDTNGPEPAGVYYYSVWVRDAASIGTNSSSLGTYDAFAPGAAYTLTITYCTSVTASAAPPSPSAQGTTVVITAVAVGCTNPRYEFWIKAPGSSTWQMAQGYSNSSSATFTWDTTTVNGTYTYSVWVRDNSSPGKFAQFLSSFDAYYAGTVYNVT